MPLNPDGIFYADTSTEMSIADITSAMATSIGDKLGGIEQTQTVNSQAERDLLYPTPVQGNSVFRNDLGFIQTYYGAYDVSTNPGGMPTGAGWYNTQKNMGLVPIIPTSVNQSGGSASYNSTTGLVTFTGVSSLRTNGVFSSSYNYNRVIIRAKNAGSTGNYSIQGRFSASGTDSVVNYDVAAYGVLASTGGTQQLGGLNATQFYTGRIYDNGVETMVVIDIASAGTVEYTNWTGNYIGSYPSDLQATIIGGRHRVATAYDGLFLNFITGATATGTMKVYGYN